MLRQREHKLDVGGHSEEGADGDRLHQRIHREEGEGNGAAGASKRTAGLFSSYEGALASLLNKQTISTPS